MKTTLKILLLLIPYLTIAQAWDGRARWDETPSQQLAIMLGNKSVEISTTYTHPLIFGMSVSIVDSKIVEKRANNNDFNKHNLNSDLTPSVFGLIGGEFEELSLIGKLGASYIDQSINGIQEKQKLYFAVGIIADYKINDIIGIRVSFDNVNSAMIGITIHLKQ